jgi:hypothetical protein
LFLVLSDFFDLENFKNAFINPTDSVTLYENTIRECRVKFEDFLKVQAVEDVDFKLEELGLNYSDLTENKFNFDLFGAFLSRASNLKR